MKTSQLRARITVFVATSRTPPQRVHGHETLTAEQVGVLSYVRGT